MKSGYRKTPLEKELERLSKREERFLQSRRNKRENLLNRTLEKKIPDKLQQTMDAAFEKAFSLVFEKGTGVIEKTYNRENIVKEFQINTYASQKLPNKKTLRSFSRQAGKAGTKNLLLSGATGMGMGILGIGLPDIPVFTGMILKNIYEIALHYGYDYKSEKERYFILLLIAGAVSYGETLLVLDQEINGFIKRERLPPDYQRANQIRKTSSALSKELLYMKFLQGIPLIGVAGGIYDAIYMRRITEYGKLKYQKRFLQGNTGRSQTWENPI